MRDSGEPALPRLVFVVGPTAAGKTALAIALAERFGGEIINADSRQVYRGMDIGTAKPTPAELARAPHHLIDTRNPDETWSLGEFTEAASALIGDITGRGRMPIVAGGTGQYARALLQGWQAPDVPPDPALRADLLARAEAGQGSALHAELAERDPQAAAAIDPRNVRRVVRALEVVTLTGWPFSEQRRRGDLAFRPLVLGLAVERGRLYARIDERVEAMFAAGLVEEVRGLLARGYLCDLPALSSIGYAEVCGLLAGALTLAETIARTKTATHRLVRRQAAWFRSADPTIHWLDANEGPPVEQATALVRDFLDRPDAA